MIAPLEAPTIAELDLAAYAPGIHRARVAIAENATSNDTVVPVFVVRAAADPTPVVGVTAVLHSNELNGIRVVHRLVETLTQHPLLRGTVVAVPITNIPGYLGHQRHHDAGADLDRIMPGAPVGDELEIYAHRVLERIIRHCDYLIDLHTAGFGQENSLHVRADMTAAIPARLARLVSPQIICHSSPGDRTLRSAAAALGIHSISVEVGDSYRLQPGLVRTARLGIQEILEHLGMLPDLGAVAGESTIECVRSFWTYTDRGGVLDVTSQLTQHVRRGERIATLRNVWGDIVSEYEAPEDGVIIARNTNPAARAGSRIVYLGVCRRS